MKKLFAILFASLTLVACGGDGGSGGGGGGNILSVPSSITLAINEPYALKISPNNNDYFECYLDAYSTTTLTGNGNFAYPDGSNNITLIVTGKTAGTETVPVQCTNYSVTGTTEYYNVEVTVTDTVMTNISVSKSLFEFDITSATTDMNTWPAGQSIVATGHFSDGTTKDISGTVYTEQTYCESCFGQLGIDNGVAQIQSATTGRREFNITNGTYEGDANYVGTKVTLIAGYPIAEHLAGRWQYVHSSETKILGNVSELSNLEEVDANHLKISNTDGSIHHLLRAGISNVRIKGKLKSFTDAAAVKSASTKKGGQQRAVVVGGIELILGQVGCYNVQQATITNPAGQLVPATTVGQCHDAYVDATAEGELDLTSNPNIVGATGQTDIIVSDSGGNTSTFSVEVIGEESDLGVLNIPDASIEYNFKSIISHLNDYIYFADLSYQKTINVCNTGTADIDGMTMAFSVDSADTDLVKSFSITDYNGAATSFPKGTCQSVTAAIEFNKPATDDDVKINIEVTNNFTAITWNDYVSFNLSQHDSVPLFFASNNKSLNGYLVAPGRQLVKVNFSSYNYSSNFVRVPAELSAEYELALAAANVLDADSYMVSTDRAPDVTLFNNFSDVLRYEPDDSYAQATNMSYFGGQHIAYLAAGDIDTYRIMDLIELQRHPSTVVSGEGIVLYLNTDLDPATIDTNSIVLTQNSAPVATTVTYNAANHSIVISPTTPLSVGTAELAVNTTVTTLAGTALPAAINQTMSVEAVPAAVTTVASVDANDFSLNNDMLYVRDPVDYAGKGYDTSSKSVPELLSVDSSYADIMRRSGSLVAGEKYCVNFGYTDLEIWDCSGALSGKILGRIPVSNFGSIRKYVLDNDHLYVSFYYTGGTGFTEYGLASWDLTDPANPVELGRITSEIDSRVTDMLYGMTIDNNRLIGKVDSQISVFDITDPANMILTGAITNSSSNITNVSSAGFGYESLSVNTTANVAYFNNLYLCGTAPFDNCISAPGLIDFSNLSAPTAARPAGFTESYNDGAVSGNRLITVDSTHNLEIYDISNAVDPVKLFSYQYSTNVTGDTNNSVKVIGNYAYVYSAVDQQVHIIALHPYMP